MIAASKRNRRTASRAKGRPTARSELFTAPKLHCHICSFFWGLAKFCTLSTSKQALFQIQVSVISLEFLQVFFLVFGSRASSVVGRAAVVCVGCSCPVFLGSKGALVLFLLTTAAAAKAKPESKTTRAHPSGRSTLPVRVQMILNDAQGQQQTFARPRNPH